MASKDVDEKQRAKLLGEYLREQTGLTSTQVVRGLRRQVMARDQGQQKLLGEILVELGYVTPHDVTSAKARQATATRSTPRQN
ncbi:MAG: hypothetical protein ACYC4L_13185 [Chloroflexota bacterium]